MKNSEGPRRYRLGPILIFFVVLTIVSGLFAHSVFIPVALFTGILAGIWFVTAWDDIVVWFYTLGKNKH